MVEKILKNRKGQFFIMTAVSVVLIIYVISMYLTQESPLINLDISTVQVYSDYNNIKDELKDAVMASIKEKDADIFYTFVNFSKYYTGSRNEQMFLSYIHNQDGFLESYKNQSDWWNVSYANRTLIKVINNGTSTATFTPDVINVVNENQVNISSETIPFNTGKRYYVYSDSIPLMPSNGSDYYVTNESYSIEMEIQAENAIIVDEFYG